jgi:signal transduction histidine kinase
MKLADHYTKSSIYTSLLVLFGGAIVYFFAINFLARQQLDQNLEMQLQDAQEFLSTGNPDPQQFDLDKDHVLFSKTSIRKLPKRFFDTIYLNPVERKIEAGRAVEDLLKSQLHNYRVIIIASRAGNAHLIQVITIITLALLLVLVIVLFLSNRYLLRGLWQPFYNTVTEIQDFNVSNVREFNQKESRVNEFNELNHAIYEMSKKVKKDYSNLKQLTENASHELMTPLAVVTTKLDTLIQDEGLSSEQLAQIREIYTSIKKSTRLNQSLILLTKLENKLFQDEDEIEISSIILAKREQFKELTDAKELRVECQVKKMSLKANSYLFEILVNNLFTNAIRHNHQKGKIEIDLSDNQMIFKNTGISQALSPISIFERFQKSKDSQGQGLGLTLVKSICQYYDFKVFYNFQNEIHLFTIIF